MPSELPIVLEHVSVNANQVRVLEDIGLTFAAGAPTVLVGPNGSGKTTLLKIAMGILAPSSGKVSWASRTSAPPLRRAFVFQHPTMLRRSAAGNIRYALKVASVPGDRIDATVEELLRRAGLDGLGERPARSLSGGEQQRLALARALAREPAVLFLDEPTASLDPAASKAFEDVMRTVIAQGIKVVMSTHDLGEARRLAGDIVMLHRGRVVENTAATAFFAAPQSAEARKFLAGELLV